MNNPIKTRRLPVKICLHPGGTTEIIYGVNNWAEPQALGLATINEPVAEQSIFATASTPSGSASFFEMTGGAARGLAQPPANELSSLRDE